MKHLAIISFLALLAVFAGDASAQTTWTLLSQQVDPLITEAVTLNDIYFIDAYNGWAVGTNGMAGGGIFKTADGGSTWDLAFSSSMFDSFGDFEYVSSTTMWAGGTKSTAKKRLLYKSTDGGSTWEAQDFPADFSVFGVHFNNENTGYVMTVENYVGKIYMTTDGGTNWNNVFDGKTSNGWQAESLSSYCFVDDSTIWVGGFNGFLMHSTDGGSTWNYVDISSTAHVNSIFFADADHGWLVAASDVLYTTDGGASWNKTELDLDEQFHDIWFIDTLHGWACGGTNGTNSGIIYSTGDGGKTWVQDTIGSPSDLKGLFFLHGSLGWACGTSKTVQQYIGQSTAVENPGEEVPMALNLEQNAPNPFNPETTISYLVPAAGRVSINIYSLSGQKVRTLVDSEHRAGKTSVVWDGTDNMGMAVSSGLYIYHISTNSGSISRKMMLLR